MTTAEIIGSALALLLAIVGGITTYINRRNKKQDEEDAKKATEKKQVDTGLAGGFKNKDGGVIARWRNVQRRLRR